jgi:hypothetical protein
MITYIVEFDFAILGAIPLLSLVVGSTSKLLRGYVIVHVVGSQFVQNHFDQLRPIFVHPIRRIQQIFEGVDLQSVRQAGRNILWLFLVLQL